MFRPEADRLQNWDFFRQHIECWKKQKHFISDDDYKIWLNSVKRINDRRKRKLSGSKDDPCQVKKSKCSVASTQTEQSGAISIDEGIDSGNGNDLDDNSDGGISQSVDNGQGGGSGDSTGNDSCTQDKKALKANVDAKDANVVAKESSSEQGTDQNRRNNVSAPKDDGFATKSGMVEQKSDGQNNEGDKKKKESKVNREKGDGGEKANYVERNASVKVNADVKKDDGRAKEESGNRKGSVESAASAKQDNGGENGKAGSETNIGVESLSSGKSDCEGDDANIDAEELNSHPMIPPLGHSSDKDNG